MRLLRCRLSFAWAAPVITFRYPGRIGCLRACLLASWCCLYSSVGLPAEHEGERQLEAAIDRARRYLIAEEAAWRKDHRCFSCHNQGLALRAVWLAERQPSRLPADDPIARWVVEPGLWQVENRLGENDQSMADLLFARTALTAHRRGVIRLTPQTLQQIAQRVASHLETGDRWPSDATSPLASPLSLGPILGTHLACRVLSEAAPEAYTALVSRCRRQLFSHTPRNVPEAAAQLWAISSDWRQYQHAWHQAWTLIQQSQSLRGGWGPYAHSPPEAFDTAIAVIGLSEAIGHHCPDEQQIAAAIAKGRDFLLQVQREEGGWEATTRPPGRDSYAQHIATTSWALEALCRCRER